MNTEETIKYYEEKEEERKEIEFHIKQMKLIKRMIDGLKARQQWIDLYLDLDLKGTSEEFDRILDGINDVKHEIWFWETLYKSCDQAVSKHRVKFPFPVPEKGKGLLSRIKEIFFSNNTNS